MLTMTVSERRACRALGQHRSTQRKVPRGRDDDEALTADLVALAETYGRYGYRKISALLKAAGWFVNDKRVERIQNGEPMTKADAKGKDTLSYVSLRRTAPGEKFQVRLFQRDEHRDAQARLLEQYRSYLLTQHLETTVRMVR